MRKHLEGRPKGEGSPCGAECGKRHRQKEVFSNDGVQVVLAHFVTDAAPELVGGSTDLFDWSFRGGISLGEVLYDVYRSLLETGKLPSDVELLPSSEFHIQMLHGNRRAYSDCLIPRLIDIVKQASENKKEFSKRS